MALATSSSLLLADAVLVVHAGIAAFVVAGPVFVAIGNRRRWRWANDLRFRVAHAAAIAIVVAESWLGLACPLTTLEMRLRAGAGAGAGEASYGGGFVEHWLHHLLYYSAPPWVFAAAYTLFACFVLMAWWYFPPRSKRLGVERPLPSPPGP